MGELATEPKEMADALKRAADLLRASRLPIIGGLRTDIAGAEAAIGLARSIGAVIDHEAGEGLCRASSMLRSAGGAPASFGEVRNRADLVVLVGDIPSDSGPLIGELFPSAPGLPRPGDHPRELVFLGGDGVAAPGGIPLTKIALGDVSLATAVALLAAQVAERPVRKVDLGEDLAKLATRLLEASFPVFVYAPGNLSEPVIHVILEIVRRLCLKSRAATFSLAPSGNGNGVNLCATWITGLPVRTRFVDGAPEHDPWLYASGRLIETGEADALLWVDALDQSGASPPEGVPTVLLTANPSKAAAEIVLDVAAAGRDRDAALFLPHLSGIGMVKSAGGKTPKPSAAEMLNRLRALLSPKEAR